MARTRENILNCIANKKSFSLKPAEINLFLGKNYKIEIDWLFIFQSGKEFSIIGQKKIERSDSEQRILELSVLQTSMMAIVLAQGKDDVPAAIKLTKFQYIPSISTPLNEVAEVEIEPTTIEIKKIEEKILHMFEYTICKKKKSLDESSILIGSGMINFSY